jgi:ribonuclease P protein component
MSSTSLPSVEFHARGYQNIRTPYFLLKVRRNGMLRNRIGVVISVAAVKSAVRRNFWRRQVKSLLAKATPSKDIIVILSPRVNTLTKEQFKKELLQSLGQ